MRSGCCNPPAMSARWCCCPSRRRRRRSPRVFAARPDGVYVVTGGLSGFGLEAARWLDPPRRAAAGAARPARREHAGRRRRRWPVSRLPGSMPRAYACDVADEAQLQRTLARIRRRQGALRGVLHAAMVLDDALPGRPGRVALRRGDPPQAGRRDGAGPADPRRRARSVRAVFLGHHRHRHAGPGRYVAANAALEALAERRHAAGLPALAVLWGPIARCRLSWRARRRVSDMLAKMLGSTHLRAAQALDGAAGAAGLRARRGGAGRDGLGRAAQPPAGSGRGRSGRKCRPASHATISPPHRSAPGWPGCRRDGRPGWCWRCWWRRSPRILKQTPSAIDVNRPMLEFGVDSLMGVELRTALEARLGVQLPLLALSGGHHVAGDGDAPAADAAGRCAAPADELGCDDRTA